MMTLDEMLALLPDNTSGQISAADLRAIITDLHAAASNIGEVFSYKWATSGTPAAGHVTMDQPWLGGATKVQMNETTDDGAILTFSNIDYAGSAVLHISNTLGARMIANITGPSVDMGAYRDLPIEVVSITGAVPLNNAQVSVLLVVTP